jgi:hypothetical protein
MDRPVLVEPDLDRALQGLAFANMEDQCTLDKDTRFVIMDDKGRNFSISRMDMEDSKSSNALVFNAKMEHIDVDLDMLRKVEFKDDEICIMCVQGGQIRLRALPHPKIHTQ